MPSDRTVTIPAIFLLLWLSGEEDLFGKAIHVVFLFIAFGVFVANRYWKVIKSRKRLNELKRQLEDGGFRICIDNESKTIPMPLVVATGDVKESYNVIPPYDRINFGNYNHYFEI